jgi:hypothetical protein
MTVEHKIKAYSLWGGLFVLGLGIAQAAQQIFA